MPPGARRTIGRELELFELDGVVAALASDRSAICVVEGEPGIGKSQLVAELHRRADSAGVRWIVGYGEPLEQGRPLHLFRDVLRPDAQVRALDGPPPAFASLLSDRHVLRETAIAEIERLARQPIVFVAEDVHWADDASVLALVDVLRLTESLPIALVLTARTSPRSPALARLLGLVRRGDHHWLELGPLDRAQSQALARSEIGENDTQSLTPSLDAASGNPFLVLELARGWGRARQRGGPVVPLDHISHVDQLTRDTIEVLGAASVLGTRFQPDDLPAIVERPHELVTAALAEAGAAAVIATDDDVSMFRHDLLREALYHDLPQDDRRRYHRRAATVLLERGRSPVEASEHLLIGSTHGDRTSADALTSAGATLVTIDPERALVLVDRADEVDTDRPFAERAPRLEVRMRALAATGRLDEALAIGRGVSGMGDAQGRDHLAEVLAGLALLGNRPRDGLDELARARAATTDPVHVARLDAQVSLSQMAAGEFAAGIETARRTAAIASELGDPAARSLALAVEARLLTFRHEYERGRQLGREAVAVADLDPTGDSHRWLPWFFVGLTELDLDRIDAVDEALREGRRAAGRAHTPWAEPLYTALGASMALRAGDIDDALSLAESAVELSHSLESTQAVAWAHAIGALGALEVGDLDTAREQTTSATAAATAGSMLGADLVVRASARLAEREGRLNDAVTELHDAWVFFGAIGIESCQPVLAPDLARLAMRSGRPEVAAEVADTMTVASRRASVAWLDACRLRCVALASGDAAMLELAASGYRSTVRRLDLADTLLELDEIGASTGGRDHAAEARRILATCGSKPAPGSSAGTVAASDWHLLTPTEHAVVDLVCEGLTNTEIAERRVVSRRTVESHLARAYRKLGVRTRAQLMVLAGRDR